MNDNDSLSAEMAASPRSCGETPADREVGPAAGAWPHESGVYPSGSAADHEDDNGPETVRGGQVALVIAGAAPGSAQSAALQILPEWIDVRTVVVRADDCARDAGEGEEEGPESCWVRAVSAMKRGDAAVAVRDASRVLARRPDHAEAYALRAAALFELREYQECILDANRSLKCNPHTIAAYDMRARARATVGDHSGAVADYDLAIAISPGDAELFLKRGDAHAASGAIKLAIEDYSVAIAMNPTDARAYFKRGSLRSARDDGRGAASDRDRAMQLAGPMDADRGVELAKSMGR